MRSCRTWLGNDDGRKALLERLLSRYSPDPRRGRSASLARIVGETPARVFKAPLSLPLSRRISGPCCVPRQAQADQVRNASETVRKSVALAQKIRSCPCLRPSDDACRISDGSCAVFDGSASGLGLAGLAMCCPVSRAVFLPLDSPLKRAWGGWIRQDAALFILPGPGDTWCRIGHGIAGRRLSATRGWFTPADLAQAVGTSRQGASMDEKPMMAVRTKRRPTRLAAAFGRGALLFGVNCSSLPDANGMQPK
jgi:hypothetical protein